MKRQSVYVFLLAIVIATVSRVNGFYRHNTLLPCDSDVQSVNVRSGHQTKTYCWNSSKSMEYNDCKKPRACLVTNVKWHNFKCQGIARNRFKSSAVSVEKDKSCSHLWKIFSFMKAVGGSAVAYEFENITSFGFALNISKPSMAKEYRLVFTNPDKLLVASFKLGDISLSSKNVGLLDSVDKEMPRKSHLFLQLNFKPEQLSEFTHSFSHALITAYNNENVPTFMEVNGKDRAIRPQVPAGISSKQFEATAVAELSSDHDIDLPRTTIDVDVLAYFVEQNCELERDDETFDLRGIQRNSDAWIPNCSEFRDSKNEENKPFVRGSNGKKTRSAAPTWFDSKLILKLIELLRQMNAYFEQMETKNPKSPTPPFKLLE